MDEGEESPFCLWKANLASGLYFIVKIRGMANRLRRLLRPIRGTTARTVFSAVSRGKDRRERMPARWREQFRTFSRRSRISRPAASAHTFRGPSVRFQGSCRSSMQSSQEFTYLRHQRPYTPACRFKPSLIGNGTPHLTLPLRPRGRATVSRRRLNFPCLIRF